jgi:hypothetical protein
MFAAESVIARPEPDDGATLYGSFPVKTLNKRIVLLPECPDIRDCYSAGVKRFPLDRTSAE